MAEDTIKKEKEEESKPFRCERCGWGPKGASAPQEEDQKEYLRCLLGLKDFTKTYSLHGGQVRITFRSCSSREAEQMNTLLNRVRDEIGEDAIRELGLKLKLLQMLIALELSGKKAEYKPAELVEPKDIGPAFDARFGALGEMLVRAMVNTLMLFSDLQALLVSEGFDANFWKGAGLRSR